MASMEDIKRVLDDIYASLPQLIAQAKLNPNQVLVMGGLSDLSKTLGLIQSGEFRAGNGLEPGMGFTGMRIAWPALSYAGQTWHLVGISNDVIQFGVNALDGTAWAGAGAIRMTASGLLVYNGAINTGAINADGDLFLGSNIANPSTTSLCVFASNQTYNGEAVGAGDVLIGDNSSGKANLLWDSSASTLKFRNGTIVVNSIGTNTSLSSVGAAVRRVASQNVGAGVRMAITFDTIEFDDASFFTLINPVFFTVPAGLAGRYLASVFISLDPASLPASDFEVYIMTNGVSSRAMAAADVGGYATTIENVPLSVGDTLNIDVNNLDLVNAVNVVDVSFWIQRMR